MILRLYLRMHQHRMNQTLKHSKRWKDLTLKSLAGRPGEDLSSFWTSQLARVHCCLCLESRAIWKIKISNYDQNNLVLI